MSAADPLPQPEPGASLEDDVESLLRDDLLIDVPAADTDLFATGLLDSLGVVQVLVGLEDRFGIEMPAGELDVDDFRSVKAIAAFVSRARGAQ